MNLSRTIISALLGRRLAVHSGSFQLDGLRGKVRIDRDRYGVPHIEAAHEEDAWFAQGFCQGQDRCFQLESLARVARGTISELVGIDGLEIDRISRRVGFFRHARAQCETFDEETRSQLRAFAKGVTLGKTVGTKRPHEFVILRAKPTPFEPEDTVALLALMNFLLASNWDAELTRLKIAELDGIEALRALDRPYPEWLPSTLEKARAGRELASAFASSARPLISLLGVGGGSNNWAISGARTRTGRPIVANDPHLAPLAPPQWYLSHVRTPGWAIAGASLVGAPGVVSGHNGFAAWGVTAGLIDNTDLFIEEIGPDGASAREEHGYAACEVVSEEIAVRGRNTVTEKVLITPRGPIVSPAIEGSSSGTGAFSLKASWLERLPMKGVLELQRARNFTAFRACFEKWPGLSLNFVYADTRGDIAWQLVGLCPRRKTGTGFVPLPAWEKRFDWDGLAPFEALPHVLNPPDGFVATANGKPTHSPEIDLGDDWLDGYRTSRIQAELSLRKDWDVQSTLKLQLDQRSQPWAELRETVLGVLSADPERPKAWALLETWDGKVEAGSSAATLFELLLHEMIARAIRAKAPHSADWALGRSYSPQLIEIPMFAYRRVGWIVRLLRERPDGWFAAGWNAEIAEAFRKVCNTLEAERGSDSRQWKWGELRKLEFKHPLGRLKAFRKIFNHGPFPWGGDTNTIGQAAVPGDDPFGNPGATPSLRVAIDVGDWGRSRFVLPGGQSGNPTSPNYDDLLELWKKGEGIPIAWEPEAAKAAAVARLELLPVDQSKS